MPYFTSVLDDRNQPLPLSSNPTHWFTAAADGTVTGTNGPDAIYATSGHATLIGNGGDDTFYVNSHDTVAGGAGVDTVVTYWGGFALPEDVENLVVTGDGAVARGNRLDNLIAGGAGRQTFFGGGGHDVFEGGADSDIFVASRADHGNVVVNDFQSGVDRIRLDGFTAFTDFTSVQNSMTQAGGDVVVNLGDGQTLTLRGHQTTDFSAADFWTAIDLSHFQLAFADEFNSFDWSPDGSHGWRTTLDWEARTLPANHEAQYYSDSSVGVNPFHLHDGVLDIAATAGSNPLGLPYNSGVITTQGSFSQLYGYFEMRAELPAGAGLWPTFWLLPANHSWPPELDVFEVLGSDPTTAVATVHSASTGAHTRVASAVATADLSEGFHTFGVNWKPDIIQWYIDGVEVAEAPTPADMHQPMYLLANLAVGGAGSWPGVADPSAFPATMTIDYIHVYRSSPDINTPQHHVPVVTAPDVAATHGQSLAASALFSVSDADADTITKYQFWDSTIRQRPFGIAGAWQAVPLRVRAPHRRLRCMGKLFRIVQVLRCRGIGGRLTLDRSHDGLTARMHMHVFNRDFLLPFAAVAVERVEQHRIGAGELISLAQVLATALERLVVDHRPPVAFHCGIMRRDELGRDHSFNFVFGFDSA